MITNPHDMITEPTIYSGHQANSASTPLPPHDLDFASIDGPVLHWSQRFPVTMLRLGRILLKNEAELMNVSDSQVSRLMARHGNELPGEYTGLQIRQELYKYPGELRGGGVKVEWQENLYKPYRTVPHYDFNFSQILRPEDLVLSEPNYET
jgi:hypothetical protein